MNLQCGHLVTSFSSHLHLILYLLPSNSRTFLCVLYHSQMYCYYYFYSPVYLYTSTIVVPVKPENDHRDAEVVEPIPSLSEHTAKYCEIVKIVI